MIAAAPRSPSSVGIRRSAPTKATGGLSELDAVDTKRPLIWCDMVPRQAFLLMNPKLFYQKIWNAPYGLCSRGWSSDRPTGPP